MEVEDKLPVHCQVEVMVDIDGRSQEWPKWVKARGLQNVIPTQAFARRIFDKVNELKVVDLFLVLKQLIVYYLSVLWTNVNTQFLHCSIKVLPCDEMSLVCVKILEGFPKKMLF